MKLKYYLRGLGIGMLVTVLLMGISNPGGGTLSEAEIKQKAAELGMVEADSLTLSQKQSIIGNDGENKPEEQDVEETKQESESEGENSAETEAAETETAESITAETETAEAETAEIENEETDEIIPKNTVSDESKSAEAEPESSEAVETTETSLTGQTADVVIVSGDNSASASRKLAEAGLISDAGAFDRYLCDNGYSKKVRAGVYKISFDKSEEEIAEIITGKK